MELDNSDIFPFIRYFPKLIINDTEFTLFKGEKKYQQYAVASSLERVNIP